MNLEPILNQESILIQIVRFPKIPTPVRAQQPGYANLRSEWNKIAAPIVHYPDVVSRLKKETTDVVT